jgi:acetyl esterase/lipase
MAVTRRGPVSRTEPGPLTEGTAAFPILPPTLGPAGELRYDNLVYSCEAGYRPRFLDLRLPPEDENHAPVIVWIHGGGWIYGSRRRLPPHLFAASPFEQMIRAGFAVACIDYRLARETDLAGMLLDVKAAVRWLRGHAGDFGLDPQRVVLWGESAGAHLAVMTAICDKPLGMARTGEFLDQPEDVTAVVSWYGPADLAQMAGQDADALSEEVGSDPENPAVLLQQGGRWSYREMSSVSYADNPAPPMFLAHGTDDGVVPVSHSRQLLARLRLAGTTVEYLEVPGADHVWVNAPSVPDIVTTSLAFLSKALP